MGTPIKQLLSPKILSPLSPIVAGRQKATHKCENNPFQTSCARNIAKTLNFQVSPNNLIKNDYSTLTKLAHKTDNKTNIKIKVTDCSKESLLINTPNKSRLMKDGLNSPRNLNILGKGSFGIVVHGIYKGIDVAAKIVRLSKNNLSSLRESNALYLTHENIITLIDIIHSHDTNYGIILMEYLKFSRHLQSILDDQSINLNKQIVVKYALDVCKGLQYCHENEVLHLDVKPSNILVCEGGLCKLCDFGNSVKLNGANYWSAHQCTVAYAAPEILLGKPPTSSCDVYSLGILLWQMKYREIPYSELDGMEVTVYKVVKFGYRPKVPSASVEDEYSSIFSSCWAANPSNRPKLSYIVNIFKSVLYVA